MASPVPILLEVGVAHGGPGADAEVVVEAALGLAGQHAVVVLQTRVAAGHQPAVVVTLHPGHTAMRWLINRFYEIQKIESELLQYLYILGKDY